MAFSIMCLFLTVLYAGFAVLTYLYGSSVLDELEQDERIEATNPKGTSQFAPTYSNGYIGERFDVRRDSAGFVSPGPPEGTLA